MAEETDAQRRMRELLGGATDSPPPRARPEPSPSSAAPPPEAGGSTEAQGRMLRLLGAEPESLEAAGPPTRRAPARRRAAPVVEILDGGASVPRPAPRTSAELARVLDEGYEDAIHYAARVVRGEESVTVLHPIHGTAEVDVPAAVRLKAGEFLAKERQREREHAAKTRQENREERKTAEEIRERRVRTLRGLLRIAQDRKGGT